MATKPEYKELAETIMFGGASISNGHAPYGFEYRRNKTLSHLKEAVARGIKNGRGKIEFEISAMAVQLEKVLRITEENVR